MEQLGAERVVEPLDGVLGAAVGGLQRDAAVGERAPDLDDRAAVAGAHPAEGRHRPEHHAVVRHVGDPPELLGLDVPDRGEHRRHGVVHPHVDGAELAFRALGGGLDLPGIRHIGRHRDRRAARPLHLLGGHVQAPVAPGHQGHPGTLPAERDGRGTPDARRCPGHHHDRVPQGFLRHRHRLRYRSTSEMRSSSPAPGRDRSGRNRPPLGSSTPSNAIASMRSWSAKYSRCRRFGTAAQGATLTAGAQCADTSSPCAADSAATRRNSVIPPHRVTSTCRQSTAPASSIRAKYARSYPYSPAVTSWSTRSRISLSPSRSSEDTGSSNQVTSEPAMARATRTACFREYAPLASTYSSTPSPTTDRAYSIRSRSRSTSRPRSCPILILTRGNPRSRTHPSSCRSSWGSDSETNPPLPYSGISSCTAPRSSTNETPSTRALRSHSAQSTAETACDTTPGRPWLRMARTMSDHTAPTSMTSRPATTGRSVSATTRALAAAPYVYPIPVRPPPETATTTMVVESHVSVPSASGSSSGNSRTATSSESTFAITPSAGRSCPARWST